MITPAKNLWHCLGACQAGGSVIDWVMRAEGVSFRHAVELLQADALPLAAALGPCRLRRPPKRSTVKSCRRALETRRRRPELLGAGDRLLPRDADRAPRRSTTCRGAGSSSEEAIAHFKLGFANRTLGLPACRTSTARRARRSAARLERIGLLRESGHEHFNGSLVDPGLATKRRTRDRGLRPQDHATTCGPGTPLHLYLPGPHRGVWNVDGARRDSARSSCAKR